MKATIKALAAVCMGALVSLAAMANDVFSDAAIWHRGFVDANGNGVLDAGNAEFPDGLVAGDASSANHQVFTNNSVTLRTEMVRFPYANTSREETIRWGEALATLRNLSEF